MIDKNYEDLSISGQCKLLEVSRSTFYYTPQPESESELDLMAKIDELHLNRPYLGSRGIRRFLKRQGRWPLRNARRGTAFEVKPGIGGPWLKHWLNGWESSVWQGPRDLRGRFLY